MKMGPKEAVEVSLILSQQGQSTNKIIFSMNGSLEGALFICHAMCVMCKGDVGNAIVNT